MTTPTAEGQPSAGPDRVERIRRRLIWALLLPFCVLTSVAAVEGFSTEDASHPGTVPSPMVGTAYRSAEPGAAPFIEVGTKVTAGETLLIIEAMKTMNQIPSPHAGTVLAILFDDGQPVEYGEPLVIVERG